MEYNEKSAQEIAEKYNIPTATLRTWQHRGKIPDKYFKDDFQKRKPASTPKELDDYNRGIAILRSEKINKSEICRIAGLKKNVLMDAIRPVNPIMLNYADYLNIKKDLQRLRIRLKEFATKNENKKRFSDADFNEIDKLLADKRIILSYFLDSTSSRNAELAYERTNYRSGAKKGSIKEDWEILYIIDRISLFLLETAL